MLYRSVGQNFHTDLIHVVGLGFFLNILAFLIKFVICHQENEKIFLNI